MLASDVMALGVAPFGMLLEAARLRVGISAVELAGRMRISPSQVTRWEQGHGRFDGDTLGRLAECLGLSDHETDYLRACFDRGETHTPGEPWTVEECEWRIGGLGEAVNGKTGHPIDLLLSVYWQMCLPLMGREERARWQLANLAMMRATRYTLFGARKRATTWARYGVELVGPLTADKLGQWAGTMFRKGYLMRTRERLDHLLEMEVAIAPYRSVERLSQIAREQATCALRLGATRQAEHFMQTARERADEAGRPEYVVGADVIASQYYLASGRADEAARVAQPVLEPEQEAGNLFNACERRLLWAKICRLAGERAAEQEHLHHLYRIARTHDVMHLVPEVERREFESKG